MSLFQSDLDRIWNEIDHLGKIQGKHDRHEGVVQMFGNVMILLSSLRDKIVQVEDRIQTIEDELRERR